MPVNYINLSKQKDGEALEVLNDLAEMEDRKTHDVLRRLILGAGKQRLEKLKAEKLSITQVA